MPFDDAEQRYGRLQDSQFSAGAVEFAESIEEEGLAIDLFAIVEGMAGRIEAPVRSAVFVVKKMVQQVFAGAAGHHQITGIAGMTPGRAEGPQDAAIQY